MHAFNERYSHEHAASDALRVDKDRNDNDSRDRRRRDRSSIRVEEEDGEVKQEYYDDTHRLDLVPISSEPYLQHRSAHFQRVPYETSGGDGMAPATGNCVKNNNHNNEDRLFHREVEGIHYISVTAGAAYRHPNHHPSNPSARGTYRLAATDSTATATATGVVGDGGEGQLQCRAVDSSYYQQQQPSGTTSASTAAAPPPSTTIYPDPPATTVASSISRSSNNSGLRIRVINTQNEEIMDLKLPDGAYLQVSSLGTIGTPSSNGTGTTMEKSTTQSVTYNTITTTTTSSTTSTGAATDEAAGAKHSTSHRQNSEGDKETSFDDRPAGGSVSMSPPAARTSCWSEEQSSDYSHSHRKFKRRRRTSATATATGGGTATTASSSAASLSASTSSRPVPWVPRAYSSSSSVVTHRAVARRSTHTSQSSSTGRVSGRERGSDRGSERGSESGVNRRDVPSLGLLPSSSSSSSSLSSALVTGRRLAADSPTHAALTHSQSHRSLSRTNSNSSNSKYSAYRSNNRAAASFVQQGQQHPQHLQWYHHRHEDPHVELLNSRRDASTSASCHADHHHHHHRSTGSVPRDHYGLRHYHQHHQTRLPHDADRRYSPTATTPEDYTHAGEHSSRNSSLGRSLQEHSSRPSSSTASRSLREEAREEELRPPRPRPYRRRRCEDLPLEWWEREEGCKAAKTEHMAHIDRIMDGDDEKEGDGRERLVMLTTLYDDDIVLEPNMFPYDCPPGIEHYTLWSVRDLSQSEIRDFVDNWLAIRMPHVTRWQYDDNAGERSILLFHVHVFIETRIPRNLGKLVRRKRSSALIAPEPLPPLTTTAANVGVTAAPEINTSTTASGATIHDPAFAATATTSATDSVCVMVAAGQTQLNHKDQGYSDGEIKMSSSTPEREIKMDVDADNDLSSDDDDDDSEYEAFLYEYDEEVYMGELLPPFQVNKEVEYFPPHMQGQGQQSRQSS